MNSSDIVEIPSFFQSRSAKKLTFSKAGLVIEKVNSFEPAVSMAAENIMAFRHGALVLRGYAFPIGRRYFVELKDFDGNTFKIQFKSYYGIRREAYRKVWSEIINQLWNYYFGVIYNDQFRLYQTLQSFDFAGVKFLYDGLSWDSKNKLLWEEIAISSYRTYFTVHHAQNPKQYKSFNFANDWNALVLQHLLKNILMKIKTPQ